MSQPSEPEPVPQTIVLKLPEGEAMGTHIGRYKLLQKLGEGGCGFVFMAEQEQPLKRRVALKVIKLGMGTRQVVARFEAERQALAILDNPSIAKVLDAGATENARYRVRKLVQRNRGGRGGLLSRTAFSPEGLVLSSLDSTGLLHLWRAPSWAEIQAADPQ